MIVTQKCGATRSNDHRIRRLYLLIIIGCWALSSVVPPFFRTQFCSAHEYCVRENKGKCSDADCWLVWSAGWDVHAYYGFLLSVGIYGQLCRSAPTFRRWMSCQRATRLTAAFSFVISPAELLLRCALVGLYAFWFGYWWGKVDATSRVQRLGKTTGHWNELTISLLVLLASKASIWEAVVGVSWEASLFYHRALGYVATLTISLHLVIWYAKWVAIDGTWLQSAFTFPEDPNVNLVSGEACSVSATLLATCGNGHRYWIPAIQVVFVGWAVAMVLTRSTVRRASYETFRMAHNLNYALMAVSLYHAWQLWHYLIVGLLLLLASWLISAQRSARAVYALTVEALPCNVTRLALVLENASHARSSGRRGGGGGGGGGAGPHLGHSAGQYLFLNIPSIDPWQWHPFTISSSAYSPLGRELEAEDAPGCWTHHIRAMPSRRAIAYPSALTSAFAPAASSSTWTSQLHQLALSLAATPPSSSSPTGSRGSNGHSSDHGSILPPAKDGGGGRHPDGAGSDNSTTSESDAEAYVEGRQPILRSMTMSDGRSSGRTPPGTALHVRVDGPFGCPQIAGGSDPWDDSAPHTLLILCGGIGVTPAAAILSDWHARLDMLQDGTGPGTDTGTAGSISCPASGSVSCSASASADGAVAQLQPPRRAVLVWSVREPELCTAFEELISALRQRGEPFFDVRVHLTAGHQPPIGSTVEAALGTGGAGHCIGRPDYYEVIGEALRRAPPGQASRGVGVMVVGPRALEEAARRACDQHVRQGAPVQFHVEEFEL